MRLLKVNTARLFHISHLLNILCIIFIVIFFKRFFKNFFKENFFLIQKLNKRKTFFYKKRFNLNILCSKRLSIVLKKKKNKGIKLVKRKKHKSRNKFFFKKFFFKTLIKSRIFLKLFFFPGRKPRQTKLTKLIFRLQKGKFKKNASFEFNITNILQRCHFFSSLQDCVNFIKNKGVYVNDKLYMDVNIFLNFGDCIRLPVCRTYYRHIKYNKIFLKKSAAIFKKNAWIFFKKKILLKISNFRRKLPKFLKFFFFYKLNVPKYLEVDYLTLTIFLIYKNNSIGNSTYIFNKLFTKNFFKLYNWKKIN